MKEKLPRDFSQLPQISPLQNHEQARKMDEFTIKRAEIPSASLMEVAGGFVYQLVKKQLKKIKHACKIWIFVGSGNNGGDAIVCARRLLASGIDFEIIFLSDEKNFSSSLKHQYELLNKLASSLGKPISKHKNFPSILKTKDQAQRLIIVDGILGSGINKKPVGNYEKAIDFINQTKSSEKNSVEVIAIDIPSGLTMEAKTPFGKVVDADFTITFQALKRAQISEPTKQFCGKVSVADIGLCLNEEISNFFIDTSIPLVDLLAPTNLSSHKGNYGHVAVFRGCEEFLGAPFMSALGALKTGAGKVSVLHREKIVSANLCPFEIMHKTLPNNFTKEMFTPYSSAVIGPGFSRESNWQEYLTKVLESAFTSIPLWVFDADAIFWLSQSKLKMDHPIICTPHSKEAAELLGCQVANVEDNRFEALEALAKLKIGCNKNIIWVLKGATPLVFAPNDGIFAFKGDVPILSTGGSGDVLSGMIASFLAQTHSPLKSVLLALSLQLSAAKNLQKKYFRGAGPTKLAKFLPKYLKNFTK